MNDVIIKQYVKENLDILIDNYDDFLATMYGMVPKIENPIRSVQFVVDNYNLGLTRLENPDIKNKNSKSIIVPSNFK